MSFRIRSRSLGTLIGGDLAVDIDHTEDSFTLGDETNKLTFVEESGTQCIPVKPLGGGDASASNQTSGAQKTQITDDNMTDVAEIEDVGGEKALKVSVISSIGGAAAPAHVDDSAFTVGTSEMTPIGGVYQATPDSVDDGDAGALRMTADRKLMVDATLDTTGLATEAKQDSAITELQQIEALLATIDADTGAIAVDIAALEVLLTQIDADTGNIATSTSSIDTKASTIIGHVDGIEGLLTTIDADTGAMATDLAAIETLLTTQNGHVDGIEALLTTIDADTSNLAAILTALQTLDNIVVGNEAQVDVITLPGVAGDVANDTSDSGNPVKIGAIARGSTVPLVSAQGDRVNVAADLAGRLLMTPYGTREQIVHATGSIATTTNVTMFSAGGAGVFTDLLMVMVTNANSTTEARVQLRDSAAGTIRWEMIIAPLGGAVIQFPVPLTQATANNTWEIDLQSSVSTVYWNAIGIQRVG